MEELKTEEKLNLELKKLKALNKVNMEAWERLSLYKKQKKTQNSLFFTSVEYVRVKNKQVVLVFKEEKIVITSFEPCFKNVVNRFHRNLPSQIIFASLTFSQNTRTSSPRRP